jgi:SAM-dependent methyltransferase
MSNDIYDSYSYYYDLLYRDKSYLKETEYIKDLLSDNNVLGDDILEFGSGTGKHGSILSDYGYKVHGIERSAKMLSKAKKKINFSFQQGDISSINLNKKYDAVISLFHVISYQTTNKNLKMVFTNAAKHLKIGGLFIFDFWYSPAVYKQIPSIRIKRISDEKVKITRLAEPKIFHNENKVEVKYTIFVKNVMTDQTQVFQEVHPMRHFSLPELDMISNDHGFKYIKSEEFLTGNQASENTWGLCMVLRKIK